MALIELLKNSYREAKVIIHPQIKEQLHKKIRMQYESLITPELWNDLLRSYNEEEHNPEDFLSESDSITRSIVVEYFKLNNIQFNDELVDYWTETLWEESQSYWSELSENIKQNINFVSSLVEKAKSEIAESYPDYDRILGEKASQFLVDMIFQLFLYRYTVVVKPAVVDFRRMLNISGQIIEEIFSFKILKRASTIGEIYLELLSYQKEKSIERDLFYKNNPDGSMFLSKIFLENLKVLKKYRNQSSHGGSPDDSLENDFNLGIKALFDEKYGVITTIYNYLKKKSLKVYLTSKGDHKLQANARLLQSHYRETVLKQEAGYGPNENSETRYGNMIVNGHITGKNFLTEEIFEYAKYRCATKKPSETIEQYRLMNNMLSSMPMCFNMFVPLRLAVERNEEFVNRLFRELLIEVGVKQSVKRILRIEIEYVPLPIAEYLNDKTAFDAFVVYEMEGNQKGILGIEAKYTDSLGKNNPKDMNRPQSVAAEVNKFTDIAIRSIGGYCPQIVRNYLLTEKYRLTNNYDISNSIVIALTADTDVEKEIFEFNGMLNSEAGPMKKVSWERFVQIVTANAPVLFNDWIKEFNNRYLDFSKVENY